MITSDPTIKDLADEAEFQLIVARENLQWLSALARAIARDAKDADGRDVEHLIGLVSYLDDTGFSGIDDAIAQFKAASAGVAT
ncbi:hypothetical protein PkoCFBP13504_22920 [Pseudomonas koreensis]|uniref:hypothetical protein n=1 Tax=Pseudomonas koreensis TaxID=198620 RepID=UPI0010C05B84|nr:hypothetical protein [Pseudomonas koreensis]TKJ77777.1 hypothetical protein PkoCFBP13504_22920 [Pseudomonas koreensis]